MSQTAGPKRSRRSRQKPPPPPSLIGRLRALQGRTRILVFSGLAVVIVVIIAATAGTTYAIGLENNDSFCASCHTEPEAKYYQQSQGKSASTLAAFHTQKGARCIDCHSGGGALGRVNGLTQGAQDLAIYYSGKYHNPAVTINKLGDGSCIQCHANVMTDRTFNNHFHRLLPQWQSFDPNAAHCVDCHTAHPTGDATQGYLNTPQVQAQCDGCHRFRN